MAVSSASRQATSCSRVAPLLLLLPVPLPVPVRAPTVSGTQVSDGDVAVDTALPDRMVVVVGGSVGIEVGDAHALKGAMHTGSTMHAAASSQTRDHSLSGAEGAPGRATSACMPVPSAAVAVVSAQCAAAAWAQRWRAAAIPSTTMDSRPRDDNDNEEEDEDAPPLPLPLPRAVAHCSSQEEGAWPAVS